MADVKKDVLEFPLEELEVPQAIMLMMQAATTCVTVDNQSVSTDDDRLQLLAEKLEAYIEDKIETAKAIRDEPVAEDNPNEPIYTAIDGHKVTLVESHVDGLDDPVITKVVVDNMAYQLPCNELINSPSYEGALESHPCIKRWGHQAEHQDMEGNIR